MESMQEIVDSSLPGVRYLANRIASRLPAHIDVEDLVQVGLIGLLQSADRYDPSRGVKFQTYANRRVEGAMLDYLRSLDWRPRSVRRRSRELDQAVASAEQRLGESASQEDLAREMGISASELDLWIRDACSSGEWHGTAFAEQSAEDSPRDLLAELRDPSDSPEETVKKQEMLEVMTEAVNGLPGKERLVISMYYYEHCTMKEIGDLLGVRQGRVSQLHSQAIGRLRKRIQFTHKPPRHSPVSAARGQSAA
jgi:RNA polymerase sigma factor for flagellar operon FliA